MKLFQKLVCMALTATATASLSICAFAADYTFDTAADTDYYPSTSYEDTYGTAYHYGSKNLVDYQIPELPYGVLSTTQTGVMEKLRLPGLQQTVGGSASGIYGVDSGVGIPAVTPVISSYQEPAYTSAKDMERKDGSIGTLKIPSLDINMKVWEGETKESMKKGLGHYSSTSAWDGNIGVCGHNRGAKYTIGSIKDLEIGDTITYTTIYGTRTYEVILVKPSPIPIGVTCRQQQTTVSRLPPVLPISLKKNLRSSSANNSINDGKRMELCKNVVSPFYRRKDLK